jgi:superoxide dismutase, Fe-Mn family
MFYKICCRYYDVRKNCQKEIFMGNFVPYKLPELPYDFAELEPVISAEIMQLHYSKHHNAYVTNLNTALEKYCEAESKSDIATMIGLQQAIKFNGGGHVNHSVFWTNLAPQGKGGGEAPTGELAKALQQEFGSVETFIEKFSALTVAIQGSGWGWLGYNKASGKLAMATCSNQDPLSTQALIPLLGIDVWEHAYYLQYKNVRADYVKNIWKVVNWKNVEQRFELAKK